MLHLNYSGLQDRAAWEAAGIALPQYDWKEMCAETEANPTWVHFGAGNIFRSFIAKLQHDLLNRNLVKGGIIAADTFDYDNIDMIYNAYDALTMLVLLLPDGTLKKEVVASIAKGLKIGGQFPDELEELKSVFRSPSLQMVSFTITEKGYALKNLRGEYSSVVQNDFAKGPVGCSHTMSVIAAMLWERYISCKAPLAVVSMDNCSHNGEKLRSSVMTIVDQWLAHGFVTEEFARWVRNEENVSFPWSMIDKITPRPAKVVEEALRACGVADMSALITPKNTFVAPFVNAEEPQYLVIEDRFPNGRPPLEQAGVYFTDRNTVNQTETMKVTTCLNPLHTALAVYGCLLGYTSIAAEMKDPELRALVEGIGYREGLPVVVDPKILNPKEFIAEVVNQRLPNPFIPDTPQRIATDTSQKMPIRFGETIKSYEKRKNLDPASLNYVPLAIAGWLRYLLAVDDTGNPMTCSGDPMLDVLQCQLSSVKLGHPETLTSEVVQPILSNANLFGVDLYKVGLAEKVQKLVQEMLSGPGAVRACLKAHV